MKTHHITLRVTTDKDLPNLAKLIAQRAYTMDGVHDVEVTDLPLIELRVYGAGGSGAPAEAL